MMPTLAGCRGTSAKLPSLVVMMRRTLCKSPASSMAMMRLGKVFLAANGCVLGWLTPVVKHAGLASERPRSARPLRHACQSLGDGATDASAWRLGTCRCPAFVLCTLYEFLDAGEGVDGPRLGHDQGGREHGPAGAGSRPARWPARPGARHGARTAPPPSRRRSRGREPARLARSFGDSLPLRGRQPRHHGLGQLPRPRRRMRGADPDLVRGERDVGRLDARQPAPAQQPHRRGA